ncbi:hypothetical protein [Cognatishimia maritima]|uniref:Uncharacterized protein n=1 Tax=Cognatishimia maritima TaxID=870908 RepID=A0A1M5MS04_9RHOB|nr:hypothetical protein [Cognatishimia maritima]SHG79679.1 hypothetical protein SAMN04488044_1305 [Cognatishimia maritima]
MYMSHLDEMERNRNAKALQRVLLSVAVFGTMVAVLGGVAYVGLSGMSMDMSHLIPNPPTMVQ